jgi:hypothetical protein
MAYEEVGKGNVSRKKNFKEQKINLPEVGKSSALSRVQV